MAQEDIRISGTFGNATGGVEASKTVTAFSVGTTSPALTTDTTDASGRWDLTRTLVGRYDAQLVTGSETHRLIALDKFQVTELHGRNPTTLQPAGQFWSTTSEASSLVAIFGFRPATESSGVETPDAPSDGDEGYIDYELSNSNATPQPWIAGRFTWVGADVSDGTEDGRLEWDVMTAGTLASAMTLDGAGLDIAASTSYAVAGTDILSDSGGTMTLKNIDALDSTTTTTINAALSAADIKLNDDVDLAFGTNADILLRNRASLTAANEEITDIILGTSVHPGVAADSLLVSNITPSGDIMFLTNRGGNSEAHILMDASTGITHLYGQGVEVIKAENGTATVFGNIVVSGTVDGVDIAARDHAVVTTIVELDTTATGANLTELTDASVTTLHSHSASGASIATGTYTGDGATSQAITGVGFTPKFVQITDRITADGNSLFMMFTSNVIIDDSASGAAVAVGNTVVMQDNTIIALGSDGFTVDDDGADANPNKNTIVYNYIAIG